MKYFVSGVLTVILIAGILVGIAYLTNQKKQTTAISIKNTEAPADDVEIVPLKVNGIEGIEKTINAETGGTISLTDSQKNRYTLTIPPGSLDETVEIQLAPLKQDNNLRSLDFGVVVGPAELVFSRPVTLSVDHFRKTANTAVYRYSTNKQLVPQAVNRLAETEAAVPIRIASGGAYLISFNSTRREALSRLAFSNKSINPAALLESAMYLLSSGKQLSVEEKTLTTTAMQTILNDPLSPPPEVFAALSIEPLLDTRNTLFLSEFYLSKVCGEESAFSSDEYLVAAAIASLDNLEQLKTACEIKSRNALAAQQTTEDYETYAKEVVWNEQPTAVEIAFALHMLQKNASTSTLSARLLQMQKQKFDTGTLEAPSVYDFTNPPTETRPIDGYDWALVGLSIIQSVYGIPDVTAEKVQPLAEKIRLQIEANQIQGQAFCSFYNTLDMQKPECIPYSSVIETAESKLTGL
jgi:hypothetical protein